MSSCPGSTLEDYLAWTFNVVVEGQDENNPSLGIAEMLGTATRRRDVLTKEDFAPIVKLFEDFRERVEGRLEDFDDDTQSWRDYAGCCFDDLPDYDAVVFGYLKDLHDGKKVANPLVFSKREMVEFLFKRGTDFSNPVSLTALANNTATLSLGWCWKVKEGSGEFIAVRGDGETVTKQDVEHYVEMMAISYNVLHPEITQQPEEQGTPVEYITKEALRSIRPFVTLPKVIKSLSDAIAVVTAHSNHDSNPQDVFVKSRVAGILRDITNTIPSAMDYFTGNGPTARYLREHLAVETMFADDQEELGKLAGIREEIGQKFNLNPSIRLDSIEWKNIIQTFIELQDKYLMSTDNDIAMRFKAILPTEVISESGFYLYENTQRVINLVFRVNGILCTVSLMENQDPLVNVYHEWEEANINIYNVCYFPGMFKAISEEVSKLIPS